MAANGDGIIFIFLLDIFLCFMMVFLKILLHFGLISFFLHACEELLTASNLWLLACLTMVEIFIIGIFIFIHSLNISKL
jgi:hypothetical protein